MRRIWILALIHFSKCQPRHEMMYDLMIITPSHSYIHKIQCKALKDFERLQNSDVMSKGIADVPLRISTKLLI
jgi:hypothetical protein